MMRYGFYLFIDEAGDEGLDKLRLHQADGSSEYFVLSGVLVRPTAYGELSAQLSNLKRQFALSSEQELHFSDLSSPEQAACVSEIAKWKFGIVAIVSNKRNMLRYRNLRCEAKQMEIVRGRLRPRHYNWFYNGLFRYLLERASAECARWAPQIYGDYLPIKIIFARRKGFSYSQTATYLYKLQVAKHDSRYFNNRGQIDWRVVRILGIESRKPRDEAGLQVADCVASAIFRALDENWFGFAQPSYLESLKERFVKRRGSPRDYGFKLLPDGFRGPVTADQQRGLHAVGYSIRSSEGQ